MPKFIVYLNQIEKYKFDIEAKDEEAAQEAASELYEQAEKDNNLPDYHDDSDVTYDTYEQ